MNCVLCLYYMFYFIYICFTLVIAGWTEAECILNIIFQMFKIRIVFCSPHLAKTSICLDYSHGYVEKKKNVHDMCGLGTVKISI